MTVETIKKFNGGCLNCEFETDNREALEAHKCAVLCNACGQFAETSELDHYIYANPYGASVYGSEGYEKDIFTFDEPQNPAELAGKIAKYLDPEK